MTEITIEWLEKKLSIKVLLSATLIVLLMYLPPIFFEYTKAKNKTKVVDAYKDSESDTQSIIYTTPSELKK
jgi:hypothetical protein